MLRSERQLAFKEIFQQLDTYITKLVKHDFKKFKEREECFANLRILLVGKPADQTYSIFLSQKSALLVGYIDEFDGKYPAQLAGIIKNLLNLITVDSIETVTEDTLAEISTAFNTAQVEYNQEREAAFRVKRAEVHGLDDKLTDYITKTQVKIKTEEEKPIVFFKKKFERINVALSQAKVGFARELLAGFESIPSFATRVVHIDNDHLRAVASAKAKGERGVAGEFGTLVNQAKDLLKEFFPYNYGAAKSELFGELLGEVREDELLTLDEEHGDEERSAHEEKKSEDSSRSSSRSSKA